MRKGIYDLSVEGLRGAATGGKDAVATGQNVQMQLEALGILQGRVVAGGNPVREYVISAMARFSAEFPLVNDGGEFEIRGLKTPLRCHP